MKNILFHLESGGETLELGMGTPYGVLDYNGLEASMYTVTWKTAAQLDGGLLNGRRTEPRTIQIIAEYFPEDDSDSARHFLEGFFHPKEGGELTVTYNEVQRKIDYELSSFQILSKNIWGPTRFSVQLLCLQPYFKDMEGFDVNLAGLRNMFAFPLVFPPAGFVASFRELTVQVTVNNPGQLPAGMNVEIIARRGVAVNPALYNLSTGEYVRVIKTLNQYQTLRICTIPGQKRVEIDGVNAMQYIDRSSVFFSMPPGDSILKYDADTGRQNLDVYPRFEPMYLGV